MKEITNLRKRFSKTLDIGGGKRRVELSGRPRHYRDPSDGSWKDIDTTPQETGGGQFKPVAVQQLAPAKAAGGSIGLRPEAVVHQVVDCALDGEIGINGDPGVGFADEHVDHLGQRAQNPDVDPASRVQMAQAAAEIAEEILGDKVTHEFLQAQVEIGTGVCATIGEDDAKDGMKLDQSHMRKPTEIAAIAARVDASRQNRAASIAGRNCATPVNEIRPIGARASDPRVR